MGEDIALFDAAFFNLAADVASVSPLRASEKVFLLFLYPEKLTCFL